jgi:hypothetical protein
MGKVGGLLIGSIDSLDSLDSIDGGEWAPSAVVLLDPYISRLLFLSLCPLWTQPQGVNGGAYYWEDRKECVGNSSSQVCRRGVCV